MNSLTLTEPEIDEDEEAVAAASLADVAPVASLAAITVTRHRGPSEICDKPGEITLLIQLARGRRPPPVAELERAGFDAGAKLRLVDDFAATAAAGAKPALTTPSSAPGLFRRIYRYFYRFKNKDATLSNKTGINTCTDTQ